jgi:hypothetical protein
MPLVVFFEVVRRRIGDDHMLSTRRVVTSYLHGCPRYRRTVFLTRITTGPQARKRLKLQRQHPCLFTYPIHNKEKSRHDGGQPLHPSSTLLRGVLKIKEIHGTQ